MPLYNNVQFLIILLNILLFLVSKMLIWSKICSRVCTHTKYDSWFYFFLLYVSSLGSLVFDWVPVGTKQLNYEVILAHNMLNSTGDHFQIENLLWSTISRLPVIQCKQLLHYKWLPILPLVYIWKQTNSSHSLAFLCSGKDKNSKLWPETSNI